MTPTIALVGVHGYGRRHLDRLLERHARGEVRLVAIADPVPPVHDLPGVARFTGLGDLLATVVPEIVVISTPLHTHADLAELALRAGSHVLVEKPATADLPSFQRVCAVAQEAGRWCQVGFQSLGSAAVEHVRGRVADGIVGTVTGYSAVGAWMRTRAYYDRAVWAGRRRMDGRVVADGVLTNPLAHAVATVLAVADARRLEDVVEVEADDTSVARARLASGLDVVAAVTLAARERGEPYVEVLGTGGTLRLFYAIDVVLEDRPGRPPLVTHHDRVDLLDDLVDAIRTGRRPVSTIEDAGGFARVQDAVVNSAEPRAIGKEFLLRRDLPDGDLRWELPGVEEALHRAVTERRTFTELGLPWTVGY